MSRMERRACLAILCAAAGIAAAPLTVAAQPIRLGELNSYKVFPAFLEPYKKGMELAVSEINPKLASHGGCVTLLEVDAEHAVVLQFGGGCHGCGMVDVTLKQGVEKTLREQVPEVTAVRDATDHSGGEKPYYSRHEGKSAMA